MLESYDQEVIAKINTKWLKYFVLQVSDVEMFLVALLNKHMDETSSV